MSNEIIEVARDFSRYPAGRIKGDGPHSGELFREKFLIPVLEKGQRAEIHFDGARGYGSSFLEEAFGGLVRLGYVPDQIKRAFTFVSSDPSIVTEINEYIDLGGPSH